MGAGVRGRIQRLAACDRLLLLLIISWGIIGIPGNYFRLRDVSGEASLFWLSLTIILWAAIAGVVAYSLIRGQRGFEDYGFSFKTGGVVSLIILVVFHAGWMFSGKSLLAARESLLWTILGAFMEELAFRVIAIDKLILLLEGAKAEAFWAILASSFLFTIAHILSKSYLQLQGMFLSSLVIGYVYYKTRSILLPAYVHGISNAGLQAGLLIAALYCLFSLVGRVVRPQARLTTA